MVHYLLISTDCVVQIYPDYLDLSAVEEQEDLAGHCLWISTDCAVWICRPIFEEEVHQEVVLVDNLEAMVLRDHH